MIYRLREIFPSLQGEGLNTGMPATFIRFAGCNLNCPWCDTRRNVKETLPLHEVVAAVRRFKNKAVVVTGGEPTIVPGLRELAVKLKDEGFWLALETNGLYAIPETELFDYVSVSPKYFYRSKYSAERMLRKADEVRIVAEDELVVPFCRQMRQRIAAERYYISPIDKDGRMHYRRAFTVMEKLNGETDGSAAPWPPWMLSIQTHKVLGIK